jgi:hypothetical protein
MPRGPRGEKRLADVIGNAVHVMRIATGAIEERTPTKKVPPGIIGKLAAVLQVEPAEFRQRRHGRRWQPVLAACVVNACRVPRRRECRVRDSAASIPASGLQ